MTEFHRLERQITTVLRVGMWVTTITLAIGLLAYFLKWPVSGALLATGLVTIIAIPVGRIAVSFIDAIRRRDWLLAGSTLIVLSVMGLTFVYALGRR